MTINELSFLVLTSLAGEPRHGYAVLNDVRSLTDGAVRPQVATLYRTIDRLQEDGLIVEHAAEVVDGRFRRSYRLTDAGSEALRQEARRRAATAKVAATRLRQSPGWAGGAT